MNATTTADELATSAAPAETPPVSETNEVTGTTETTVGVTVEDAPENDEDDMPPLEELSEPEFSLNVPHSSEVISAVKEHISSLPEQSLDEQRALIEDAFASRDAASRDIEVQINGEKTRFDSQIEDWLTKNGYDVKYYVSSSSPGVTKVTIHAAAETKTSTESSGSSRSGRGSSPFDAIDSLSTLVSAGLISEKDAIMSLMTGQPPKISPTALRGPSSGSTGSRPSSARNSTDDADPSKYFCDN